MKALTQKRNFGMVRPGGVGVGVGAGIATLLIVTRLLGSGAVGENSLVSPCAKVVIFPFGIPALTSSSSTEFARRQESRQLKSSGPSVLAYPCTFTVAVAPPARQLATKLAILAALAGLAKGPSTLTSNIMSAPEA